MSDSDCEACDGHGWVLDGTDDAGLDYFRPCAVCRPAVYQRWVEGHFAPGHHCADCSPTGSKSKTSETPRRRPIGHVVENEPDAPAPPAEPDPAMF